MKKRKTVETVETPNVQSPVFTEAIGKVQVVCTAPNAWCDGEKYFKKDKFYCTEEEFAALDANDLVVRISS